MTRSQPTKWFSCTQSIRWPTIGGIWFVVDSENVPNDVFIQIQSKGQIDLLGDAGTTESRVALLHLNDGLMTSFDGPLGPGLPPPRGE